MKAYLEFKLPEDQRDFDIACQGAHMFCALHEVNEKLRSWLKYGHSFEDADDALDKMREAFWSILESHGIDLDRLGN